MGAEITASVSVHSYKMTPGVKSEVSQMRVLMVGLGSIGKRHLRNLQLLGQTEFHALRSGNGTCPVEGGIELRSHLDLDRALAHRPDLTVIANPTSLHVPLALAAAEAGCHLFLEKPVSNSDAGVERLEREVRQRGLVAAVGYNLRFHPVLESLREMVLNRTVGEILCARASVGKYLPDWHPNEDYRKGYMASAELGGGVILTLSHEFDSLFWLFGKVAEVTAVKSRARNLDMPTESLAEVTLMFRSGVVGQVHLDCVRRTPQRSYELIGTEGTILANINESTVRITRPSSGDQLIEIPRAEPNQMYVDEMVDLLDAIRRGRQARVPLEDGVSVLKIALAAHHSAETVTRQVLA